MTILSTIILYMVWYGGAKRNGFLLIGVARNFVWGGPNRAACKLYKLYIHNTRETAAVGGVSLALRGSAIWETAAFGGVFAPEKKNWCATGVNLKLPWGHEDSEYVLTSEIGQREGGFYSARTDTQTDTQNHLVAH